MCVRNSNYDPKIDWLKVKILNKNVEQKMGPENIRNAKFEGWRDEGCAFLFFNFFNSLVIYSLLIWKLILLLLFRPEDSPARYQEEYSKLRTWAYSSLDLYKVN